MLNQQIQNRRGQKGHNNFLICTSFDGTSEVFFETAIVKTKLKTQSPGSNRKEEKQLFELNAQTEYFLY